MYLLWEVVTKMVHLLIIKLNSEEIDGVRIPVGSRTELKGEENIARGPWQLELVGIVGIRSQFHNHP